MPSKRRRPEGAEDRDPQDPRDMAKAGLPEPQPPAVIGTPLDYSTSIARPPGYAESMRSAERSARWASGNDLDQGGERGAYVVLETSGMRKRGIAYGTRVLRRRSPHSSRRRHDRPRRAGKPPTGRRGSPRKGTRVGLRHGYLADAQGFRSAERLELDRPARGRRRDDARFFHGDRSPRAARTARKRTMIRFSDSS